MTGLRERCRSALWRVVASAGALAILVAACGTGDSQVVAEDGGADGTRLAESRALRASAVLQTREHAVRECHLAEGIPEEYAHVPVVDLLAGPPDLAGVGLATSFDQDSAADLGTEMERVAEAHRANEHRSATLPREFRAPWDECRELWTGPASRERDADLQIALAMLLDRAMHDALATPRVAGAFADWSACVRESADLDAPYPWDLRRVVEERWTDLLSRNDVDAQESLDERAAGFADFERHVREVDDRCHAAHVGELWGREVLQALDDTTSDEVDLLVRIEETRPPYLGWSAVEERYFERSDR